MVMDGKVQEMQKSELLEGVVVHERRLALKQGMILEVAGDTL
jgi:hypothetical protein